MKSCHTQTIIEAPIQTVWNVLTDVERYSLWNPTIAKVWGTLREQQLAYIHHIGIGLIVPIRIGRCTAPHELRWHTWGIFAPLLQGEHYFKLTEYSATKTELQHGEYFTGAASALMPASLLSKLQSNYAYHNTKLKTIAEQLAASAHS